MTRTRVIAALLIIFALMVLADTIAFDAAVCHEDMACWDCATMGNLTCGGTP